MERGFRKSIGKQYSNRLYSWTGNAIARLAVPGLALHFRSLAELHKGMLDLEDTDEDNITVPPYVAGWE